MLSSNLILKYSIRQALAREKMDAGEMPKFLAKQLRFLYLQGSKVRGNTVRSQFSVVDTSATRGGVTVAPCRLRHGPSIMARPVVQIVRLGGIFEANVFGHYYS